MQLPLAIITVAYSFLCANMLFAATANTWTQKAYFGGAVRNGAFGFSIGSKGYMGTGVSVTNDLIHSSWNDFWEYDPAVNRWTQKADFKGAARVGAVGFSIGSKGYVGTGYDDGLRNYEFWEYDPAANAWTQKADFGGTMRWRAVGFSIGTKGYIGTGEDVGSYNTKDFWEYDPAADTWTQKADFGGTARSSAVGFSIGSKGYIGTGGYYNNGNFSFYKDFWEYSPSTSSASLYFPHVATSIPWQTEIAIINTSDQTVTGTLRALSDTGQPVDTKPVILSPHGRRQIIISDEFTNHTAIGYIIFDTNSAAVQGYTKFAREGYYRVAIPAVKEVNTSNIYISHIAANADWWTGVSLVNTTSSTKVLTITFNNGQSGEITLNAYQHRAFNIAQEFFNNQPPPNIESGVITNASGVIGLELFGSSGWGSQLEGILLTDKITSTIYYPHVASNNEWWTGIVAYNPSELPCTITITPYDVDGTPLVPSSPPPIAGKGKYIGPVSALGLPSQTAWFRIDSTSPITGFELFGTTDGNQLAAYAEKSGTGAKAGVFAKIEKSGWTGIAFVNTEATAASVTLTAYNDNGTAMATQVLPVPGHAKVVNNPELIFSQAIGSATYIAYSSDRNVVGFQLNGSSDGTMLDGLPGM